MSVNFKNLDYLQIKNALKEHLKSLSEFQDYDFEASGIQQILSLLALNGAYNAFYLNMVGSEMFLDSAQLRSSVVSRAKALGYRPSSASAATAKIRIEVDTTSGPLAANPAFVTLSPTDQFVSYLDGKAFYFSPDRTYLIEPNIAGRYVADVAIREGQRLTYRYTVDTTAPVKQRFIIPNKNADASTLIVKIQESASMPSVRVLSRADNVNLLTETSLVYFLQESDDGSLEVYFGEDIIGVQPQSGNIVTLEYISTNGSVANGLKTFARVNKPTGYNTITISTLNPAQDGAESEGVASIKLLAPLLYEAQDRAVTKNDYEALIRKDNPNIEYVRIWGGEDNAPPDYGKVYAAIKPKTGSRLSTDAKASLINRLLKERNIVSLEVKIVDPDYLFLTTTAKVSFRSKRTSLTAADIKQKVFDAISNYKAQSLNGFDADFTYSKLISTIDSSDVSIVGNLTTVALKKRLYPSFNQPSRFELQYYNKLAKGDATNGVSAVSSSPYIYRGVTTYIGDDGVGSLYLYRLVDNQRVIIQRGIGSVDYDAGKVIIDALDVQDIEGKDFIEITVTPAVQDISTPREAILLLENADIKIFVDAIDLIGDGN